MVPCAPTPNVGTRAQDDRTSRRDDGKPFLAMDSAHACDDAIPENRTFRYGWASRGFRADEDPWQEGADAGALEVGTGALAGENAKEVSATLLCHGRGLPVDGHYIIRNAYMKLSSILLVALALAVGACSQQQEELPPEATGHAGPATHLTQAGIRVLAPQPAAQGQMALYHTCLLYTSRCV